MTGSLGEDADALAGDIADDAESAAKGLFGAGNIAEQFLVWGVLSQLAGAVLQPTTQAITSAIFDVEPTTPPDASIIAALVARGYLTEGEGASLARLTGIVDTQFQNMVNASYNPPGLSELFALAQRGLIGAAGAENAAGSLEQGLAQGGMRPDWINLVAQLAVQIPTVAEVMNAWLEGQISEDEARTRYLAAGGDPTWFQTSYNANGQAPTPTEALDMLNRGLIPEDGTGPDAISYQQAFLEGPWRNKWLTPFLGLRNYIPPPRTVTAMLKEGSLTQDQAIGYLKDSGLTGELAAAYVAGASHTNTAADKHLAKTDLLALYNDQLINEGDALKGLEVLGYDSTDAGLILKLQDMRRTASNLNSAVSRIRTLFVGGKLTTTEAQQALTALDVPPAQVPGLVQVWQLEQAASTPSLTAAEIADAVYYQVISADEGQTRIEALGWTERDAWIILSNRNHGPLGPDPGGA